MSDKSPKRKPFYCRLPEKTYRKLRKLACLEEKSAVAEQQGIMFRFRAETHEKLRALALSQSINEPCTMQGVLVALIDKARARDLVSRSDMHDVVQQLISSAPNVSRKKTAGSSGMLHSR